MATTERKLHRSRAKVRRRFRGMDRPATAEYRDHEKEVKARRAARASRKANR